MNLPCSNLIQLLPDIGVPDIPFSADVPNGGTFFRKPLYNQLLSVGYAGKKIDCK
jgi:hypothetical protein